MSTKKASCLAIITVRGGSKGVPQKNIRPVNGRSLMDYTLQVTKACPYVTQTVVTTESEEIRAEAIRLGAEAPFLRPAEFATDTAKQEDALLHAMEWYEKQGKVFDYMALMCVTTPLRTLGTLNKAFEQLSAHPEAEAIFSVARCETTPLFANTLRPGGLMTQWVDPKYKWLNRQEMPKFYRLSALITISKWETFKREKSFLHDKTLSMVVDNVEAWDINSPLDFFIAESLLEKGFDRTEDLNNYVKLENRVSK